MNIPHCLLIWKLVREFLTLSKKLTNLIGDEGIAAAIPFFLLN